MSNPKISPSREFRLCIIDDDHEVLKQALRVFLPQGFKVLPIANTIGSTNQIRKFDPHLIVLDVNMPAINGDELYALLRRVLKKLPPVIFYSGIAPEDLEKLAADYQAVGFVYKGDGIMRLLSAVNYQLFESGVLNWGQIDRPEGSLADPLADPSAVSRKAIP